MLVAKIPAVTPGLPRLPKISPPCRSDHLVDQDNPLSQISALVRNPELNGAPCLPPCPAVPLCLLQDVEKWATSLAPLMTRNALLLLPADGKRVLSWTQKVSCGLCMLSQALNQPMLTCDHGVLAPLGERQLLWSACCAVSCLFSCCSS